MQIWLSPAGGFWIPAVHGPWARRVLHVLSRLPERRGTCANREAGIFQHRRIFIDPLRRLFASMIIGEQGQSLPCWKGESTSCQEREPIERAEETSTIDRRLGRVPDGLGSGHARPLSVHTFVTEDPAVEFLPRASAALPQRDGGW